MPLAGVRPRRAEPRQARTPVRHGAVTARGSTIQAGLSIIRGITGTLDTTTMSRRAKGPSVAEIEPGEYVDTYHQHAEQRATIRRGHWIPTSGGGSSSRRLTSSVASRPSTWVNKMTAAGIEKGLLNISRLAGMVGSADDPTTAQLTLDEWRASCAERSPRSARPTRAGSSEAATLIPTTA